MILVLYNIILITNFKLIEMCIKSSSIRGQHGGFQYIYKQKETINGLQRYEIQGLAWV